jgi:hypothetical protein
MRLSKKFTVATLIALGAAGGGFGVASAVSPTPPPSPNAGAATAAMPRGPLSASAVIAPSNPMSLYVPLKNCRAVATATAGGKIPNGATRDFQMTGTTGFTTQGGTSGGCGIPAYATAVSARVTSTASDANGAFIAYPTGTPVGQGTLYYAKGVNVTTGSNLQIGTAGKITVKNVQGPSHLAIDVNGYYSPQIHAVLSYNGGVYTGSPLVLSSTRLSTGSYRVQIDRDLNGCTPTASINGSAYFASAYVSGGYVYAGTYAPNGTPTDLYWTLDVSC